MVQTKDPPAPAWRGETVRIIEKKYPDNLSRATGLLASPLLAEAKKKLDSAWRRRREGAAPYPSSLFAEVVMLCAYHSTPRKTYELPPWMSDRREAGDLAACARKIVKVAKQYAKAHGGMDSGYVVRLAREWPENEWRKVLLQLEPLVDEQGIAVNRKIVAAVQFLAGYLEAIANTPRKEGKPEDLSTRNFLCLLEDRFRADLGKPCHPVIALLWSAVSGKKKTPAAVKDAINRYRKRGGG